jgi:hypothetical protein
MKPGFLLLRKSQTKGVQNYLLGIMFGSKRERERERGTGMKYSIARSVVICNIRHILFG